MASPTNKGEDRYFMAKKKEVGEIDSNRSPLEKGSSGRRWFLAGQVAGQ